ncbi:T9SS type A sorting domain-containing protein [uncultured Hymenobacter sp.]|uniref:T9SS type A sorting domain-containing protein n=1 Tax=uncultured Hymenobacter sp. TaxID=170016 RepID=UPI0035CC3272
MYPNPATIAVRIPSVPVGHQVQLLDAVGRITHTLHVAHDATVSVRGVTPGLYVVHAYNA